MGTEIATEIRRAVDTLRESPVIDADATIRGCSDAEVQAVQEDADDPLPRAYTEFLHQMGAKAGDFLRGDDVFYPAMIGLTDEATDLMAANDADTELSGSEFAFAAHHGYVYLYFETDAGDNPPVWRYVEGESEPERVSDSFVAWLRSSIEDEIELADY